jgi:small GTP-binding protein
MKVIIVGDGAIGKTCLLARLTNDSIDWDSDPSYEPTTFNNYLLTWEDEENSEEIELELWDTAGQETFKQLRTLSYPETDVYLVGYSTQSSISLNNVKHKWIPEIQENHTGQEPPWIILVGTKSDIRDGVSESDAEKIGKDIEACLMIDTSAKTKEGCDTLKAYVLSLLIAKKNDEPKPEWADRANHKGASLVEKGEAKKNPEGQDKPELDKSLHDAAKKEQDQFRESQAGGATDGADVTPAPAKTEPAKKQDPPKTEPKTGGTKTETTKTTKKTSEPKKAKDTNDGGDEAGCSCTIA